MSAPDAAAVQPLTPKHLADLRASGLTDATIAACGFHSLTDAGAIAQVLNWQYPAKKLGPCLAIPFRDADGKPTGYVRLKPDQSRQSDGKAAKYESPAGAPYVSSSPAHVGAPVRHRAADLHRGRRRPTRVYL